MMKQRKMQIAMVLLSLCMLSACQSTTSSSDESYIANDAQYSEDGLARVSNAPFDTLFARPGLSLANYKRVWVDDVYLTYSPGIREFQLDANSQKKFTDKFKELLEAEVASKSGLQLADSAGDSTLHVVSNIIDIKINLDKDARSHVNRHRVFGEESGEMAIEVKLADSQSLERLLVFIDKQTAQSMNIKELTGISIKQDFDRVMKRWASEVAEGIKILHDKHQ